MNRIKFERMPVTLPVVHVETLDQARDNVVIAQDCGADGVFLINHSISDQDLLEIHEIIATEFPHFWIGVNCLGLPPETTFELISETVRGVWVDNSYLNERSTDQARPDKIDLIRKRSAPGCLYFGGVAFKYQRHVNDLEAACEIAMRYVNVVTTSGPGTGEAADVSKIRRMKSALGDHPLAIASGITPENIEAYLPYVDYFLVATGVSRSFTRLDPVRLRELCKKVAAFRS